MLEIHLPCQHLHTTFSFFPPLAQTAGFSHFISKASFLFPSLLCLVLHCPADSCFQDMALASNQKTNSLPKNLMMNKHYAKGTIQWVKILNNEVVSLALFSPSQPPCSHREPERKVTKMGFVPVQPSGLVGSLQHNHMSLFLSPSAFPSQFLTLACCISCC